MTMADVRPQKLVLLRTELNTGNNIYQKCNMQQGKRVGGSMLHLVLLALFTNEILSD